MMMVCPQDIRFTQDSIKNTFKPPHQFQRIDDAVDRIRKKLLSPSDFPPMNVVDHKNILWSLDNRRLWIFRRARVPAVKVNLVPQNFSRRSEEFFLNLNPRLEKLLSRPSYFPPVRGHVQSIIQDSAPANIDHPLPKISQNPGRTIVAEESNPEAKKIVHKETYHVTDIKHLPSPGKRFYDRKNPSLGKKAMDAFLFILKRSFGFLRRAFNAGERSGSKKVVILGMNALIAFSFCFMAGKAFNLGKKGAINVRCQTFSEDGRPSGSENGVSRQTLIPGEGNHGEKVGSCQNMNVGVLSFVCYTARQAFVSIGSMAFSVSGFCLNKSIYWLPIFAGHAFNIGKGVVASLGRNVLCACRVCSDRIFIWLRFVASQALVGLGRMVLGASDFFLNKVLHFLRAIV